MQTVTRNSPYVCVTQLVPKCQHIRHIMCKAKKLDTFFNYFCLNVIGQYPDYCIKLRYLAAYSLLSTYDIFIYVQFHEILQHYERLRLTCAWAACAGGVLAAPWLRADSAWTPCSREDSALPGGGRRLSERQSTYRMPQYNRILHWMTGLSSFHWLIKVICWIRWTLSFFLTWWMLRRQSEPQLSLWPWYQLGECHLLCGLGVSL